MPKLEKYTKKINYTYALGAFPSIEAIIHQKDKVHKLIVSPLINTSLKEKLDDLCKNQIRIEEAPKALEKITGKDSILVAAVVEKYFSDLNAQSNHLVLHNIMDGGNLGTILRTALGFGIRNIAIIKPATDIFDPNVIRASMGAMFQLNVMEFDCFDDYIAQYKSHVMYPFMLHASRPLEESVHIFKQSDKPASFIFGNEGSGLPEEFSQLENPTRILHNNSIDSLNLANAVAIALYAFTEGSFTK